MPFGELCYPGPNAVTNAIGYAKFYSRSHPAVIRVYADVSNVIETHEHKGESKDDERALATAQDFNALFHLRRKHMLWAKRRHNCGVLTIALQVFTVVIAREQALGEDTHDHMLFPCLEDGLKSSDSGCQLLAKMQVARFSDEPLFWHLNKFPTKEDAEAVKKQIGFAVEAEGQFWLFSFGPKGSAPKQGELVASVGPLPLTSNKLPPAKSYEILAYLAVMPPQMYTRVHIHPGPEAWYILSGEQCLETPTGAMKARAGESMFAPPTTPMRLTNNGSSTRHALFIVIHDASQSWTIPTNEWKPTGLCDRSTD